MSCAECGCSDAGKTTAAGLREWLNAMRWSDRELRFRVARGF